MKCEINLHKNKLFDFCVTFLLDLMMDFQSNRVATILKRTDNCIYRIPFFFLKIMPCISKIPSEKTRGYSDMFYFPVE